MAHGWERAAEAPQGVARLGGEGAALDVADPAGVQEGQDEPGEADVLDDGLLQGADGELAAAPLVTAGAAFLLLRLAAVAATAARMTMSRLIPMPLRSLDRPP